MIDSPPASLSIYAVADGGEFLSITTSNFLCDNSGEGLFSIINPNLVAGGIIHFSSGSTTDSNVTVNMTREAAPSGSTASNDWVKSGTMIDHNGSVDVSGIIVCSVTGLDLDVASTSEVTSPDGTSVITGGGTITHNRQHDYSASGDGSKTATYSKPEVTMALVKPTQYQTLTPYLVVRNAVAAIEFYQVAFGATLERKLLMPDGKIGHAELTFGTSMMMLAEEFPEWGVVGPLTIGGSPINFVLYVDNVDEAFLHAIGCGAQEIEPVRDQFYGDRSGKLRDPYGHLWTLATQIETLEWDEVQRRCLGLAAPS